MRWIAAALLLLVVQQAFWREPSPSRRWFDGADAERAVRVEDLLEGRHTSPLPVALVGRVVDASPTWGSGVRLTMDLESADGAAASGLLSVSLRETTRRWRSGDRLALRSRLRRIAGFGNFGELDWAAYQARRGIRVSAAAWREDDVQVLPERDGPIESIRRRYAEACARVGGQGAEILEALVIGDRTGIDRETTVAVRDGGLAHFLAISGSHMAVIVALMLALVRRGASLSPRLMERYDVMRAAALAAALAVVAYGAVCGGGVSVLRSEIMALAAMAALWRGRPGDDLRALGGSAVAIALAMPGVGEEAGFQLSFLAVTALVLDSRRRRAAGAAAPARAEDEHGGAAGALGRGFELLREAGRVSMICWVVTAALVAHHFQRVSLVAPLANLAAAPLVSAIVVSGVGGLALLPIHSGAGEAAVGLGAYLAEAVIALAKACASLPLAATATPAPSPALTAVLTALALGARMPPWPGRRAALALLVLVATALGASALHDRFRHDRLDLWFASVGQGDAAVVRMPGGAVWVVDQGPPGRGRMVVAPLLRRAWIGRIDVLVASHVQADHAGGLPELLEEFEVGEVWIPAGPCEGSAAQALLRAAEERGVAVRRVSLEARPETLAATPGVDLLWPPSAGGACQANDQSIVLSVAFAGRRVLLTGDIEAAAEAGLARTSPLRLRADLLKVPHHGSRTSSTAAFLEAVSPSLAIASMGLENSFRHPAPDVVARYEARSIRLLRTDRDGAVHVAIEADGTMRGTTFRSAASEGPLYLSRDSR
jgi:competence protein ComEC